MNIHRFILPGSIAAMVHVALFLALPEEPYIRPFTPSGKTERPPVKPPVEEIVPPPEDPEPSAVPVKHLAGGPTPPDIDAPVVLSKSEISIPVEDRPNRPITELKTVPEKFGPGDVGPIGEIDGTKVNIWRPGDLDRAPTAKVQPSPVYPAEMSHSGTGGRVMVEFDVNAEGRVVRATAVDYTHREFADPAVRAVLKWRFEPGRRHGKAVPFRMVVPIEFGIDRS